MKKRSIHLLIIITGLFIINSSIAQDIPLEDTLKTLNDRDKIRVLNEWIDGHPFNHEENIGYADRIIGIAQKINDSKAEVMALKTKGSCYFSMNDNDNALDYYLQGLALAEEIDFQEGISACLYNIGIVYRTLADYEKALEYFQQSQKIDSLSGNKENIAYSLNILGVVYEDIGNTTRALDYYQRSLSLNEEINNKEGIANALFNIGNIYRDRGDFIRAEDHFTRSLRLSEEIDDKPGMARAYNAVGNVFERRSEYDNAQESYLNALRINEEINDLRGIAQAQNNIGNVYLAMHDYESALSYFENSRNNYLRINDQEGLAISFTNIGYIHEILGNFNDAIRYYQSSLRIEERLGNKQGISLGLNRIGNIYEKELNNYEGALENYMKALELKKEIGDTLGIANTLKTIGYVHQKYGYFSGALKYLNQSLELAKEINSKDLLRTIYRIFSEFYAARGDYKNALGSFKLSSLYRDSVFTEESQQAIARMQTLYDTEKKEQENALLRKENQIQTLQISRQRNIRNSLIAISGLVLILVIVVYSRYRTKKKANELLNQKNRLLEQQKNQIEVQKIEIESKNKQITDSINYAKGIQDAMLPRIEVIKNALPNLFIYYRPRDIVSGDFYWFCYKDNKIVIAAVDCTGHGVPGGFVSMMGNDLMNEIVEAKGITEADKILNQLHKGVSKALKQQENQNRDGMDMALCVIDRKKNILEYAGAKNPLIYISNGETRRVIADKMPIGGIEDEELQEKIFTKHVISLHPQKVFYMFSDGFPDQFGGKEKKKYMSKPFRELLFSIHRKPFEQQKEILEKTFVEWMGDEPQVDDVLVVGFTV